MKLRNMLFVVIALLAVGAYAAINTNSQNAEPAKLAKGDSFISKFFKSDKENASTESSDNDTLTKASYKIGVDLGQNFQTRGVDINPDMLVQGFNDAFHKRTMKFNEEELNQALVDFRQQVIAAQTKKRNEESTTNETTSNKFLETNKNKDGIVTLPSGLQYRVITPGTGKSPTAKDTVSVKYTGKLIDGTVFDSTDNRGGTPATFRVDRVIKGWTEALQKMKVGANWELFIPSDLAYGERGSFGKIGPNQALIFNVELMEVQMAGANKTTDATTEKKTMTQGNI